MTSNRESLPLTGNGSILRTSASIHDHSPGTNAMQARRASACVIGRQSITRTTHSALPAFPECGRALAQMSRSPRKRVAHERISIVLRPDAINDAHGSRIEIAFIRLKYGWEYEDRTT